MDILYCIGRCAAERLALPAPGKTTVSSAMAFRAFLLLLCFSDGEFCFATVANLALGEVELQQLSDDTLFRDLGGNGKLLGIAFGPDRFLWIELRVRDADIVRDGQRTLSSCSSPHASLTTRRPGCQAALPVQQQQPERRTLRLVLGGKTAYGSHGDCRCFVGARADEVLAPPCAGACVDMLGWSMTRRYGAALASRIQSPTETACAQKPRMTCRRILLLLLKLDSLLLLHSAAHLLPECSRRTLDLSPESACSRYD